MKFQQIHTMRPPSRNIIIRECHHSLSTAITDCEEGLDCSKCEELKKGDVCASLRIVDNRRVE